MSRYCGACAESFTRHGKEPPCEGCLNEEPPPDPRNGLFEYIYGKAFTARNHHGHLFYEVLIRFCEVEGLTPSETADVLEKAVKVEQLYLARQLELVRRQTKRDSGSERTPGTSV